MNNRRRNLVLALVLFVAWVGGLAWMARVAGERPQSRAGARPTP